MRTRPIITALTFPLVTSIAACESDEVTDVSLETEAPQTEDLEAPHSTLAEPLVEVEHGDYTLTFLESDGDVAVVEYAPADAPPLLDALVAEDATALEILRAVAPDVDVPTALLRAHEASDGVSAATGTPVRDLTASIELANYRGGYSTNCSYAADHDYFREIRLSLGWNWRWYMHNRDAANPTQKSATTRSVRRFRAHSCNNSNNSYGSYYWGVYRNASSTCDVNIPYSRWVDPGYRVIYHRTGGKKCKFWTYVTANGYEVPHSLAIMAP